MSESWAAKDYREAHEQVVAARRELRAATEAAKGYREAQERVVAARRELRTATEAAEDAALILKEGAHEP